MAIALIPWVAGAALGSVATYLYKDEHIWKDVSRTAEDVSDKVKGAANTVTEKVSESVIVLRDKMFGKPVEKVAPAATKKTTKRKRTTAKKTAARKRVAAKAKTARKPRKAAA